MHKHSAKIALFCLVHHGTGVGSLLCEAPSGNSLVLATGQIVLVLSRVAAVLVLVIESNGDGRTDL